MSEGAKAELSPGQPQARSAENDEEPKSIASSRRSGTSSRPSVRLREAKIKQELARRKREQSTNELKLRREQFEITEQIAAMKLKNEEINATIETDMWKDEVDGTRVDEAADPCNGPILPEVQETVNVNARTEEWCNRAPQHYVPEALHTHNMPITDTRPITNTSMQSQMFDIMSMSLNLPKPEIPRFSGNPIDYWGFVNSFEVNIAQRSTDERLKLSYLIQFCSGRAHDAIENCILLEAHLGYTRAREILYEQFGRNYVVSRAHITRVLNRSPLRSGDSQGLWDLARDMRRCQMTLSQMSFTADMSTTDNLLKIQEILPVHLQSKWASHAHSLMEKQVMPNFSHMTNFVEEQAKAASNVYGMHVGKPQTQRAARPNIPPRRHGASTFATTQDNREGQGTPNRGYCPCCSKDHYLDGCEEFKKRQVADRFTFAKTKGLCFNCFRRYHTARDCRSEPKCTREGCKRKHHTLLHSDRLTTKGPDRQSGAGQERHDRYDRHDRERGTAQEAVVYSNQGDCNNTGAHKDVCLRVLPVRVKHGGIEVTTWALLDDGSDVSLCEQSLADELGIKASKKSFRLTTVSNTEVEKTGMEVSLSVEAMEGGDTIDIPKVWTIDNLPVSSRSVPQREHIDKWTHLQGIELHTTTNANIRLLIGSDTPEAFWVQEERRGQKKEPYAIRSPLGWTLMGPTSKRNHGPTYQVHHMTVDEELQTQVKRFWELDHDISDERESLGESVEDRRALSMMEETVTIVDGHYQVGLPWRCYPPNLPNNRNYADIRLQHLRRRLLKDNTLHEHYTSTVEKYITKGYATEIVNDTKCSEEGEKWYLPHHPVTHPMKPDKVRVVFDCAAKYQGVSLNSQLLQGPDYTNRLVGVLLRFRQENVALVADIEGMFHQVRVPQRDAEALRFLWWKDGDVSNPPKDYQMNVHLFGATSSPSCAGYALRKTVEDNHEGFDEDVGKTVLDNFYVDDCLKSVPTVEDGKRLIPQLCKLLARGGFRLTKWASNNKDVLSVVPPSERAASVVDLDLDHLPIERTLGVWWDMEKDTFGFKVSHKDVPLTRRGLLSATSSLYDPLGFVAPFVLRAKILLQDLCAQGKGWDEPIGEDELQRWQSWVEELPMLTSVQLDRCYKPPNSGNVSYELHIFCDASERAYSACAYVRVTTEAGKLHCNFVMGKARLCPLKKLTIPRLELSSAVLAAKLGQIVKEELRLPMETVTYWSDSTSVLQYIGNESRRFKTFVANRVAKIHEVSDKSQWRHVDTLRNPADDGSRGLPADKLSRWLTGPEFLIKEENEWPVNPIGSNSGKDLPIVDLKEDPEVKRTQVYVTSSDVTMNGLLTRYSSWDRLKRGVAWILRYKRYLQSRAKGLGITTGNKDLTTNELADAENAVITYVQRESFPAEFQNETAGRSKQRRGPLDKLHPIVCDGMLRVGGRLDKAPIKDDEKHPLIMPSHHHVTQLLVVHYHQLVGHSGAGMTWTALRERYWIVKGGAVVRSIIGNCFKCKKRNSARGQQFMADLPRERVTPDKPPFYYTGVDYFGPFLVKQGRSSVKRYGCIFTCLASRAVHLEVSHSLDTDSFIHALRRFINRRGRPHKIVSDNGSNFKCGHKELKESLATLNAAKVGRYLAQRDIDWEFNPPTASHMGGIWERMIRSVRRILGNLLSQQTVTDEALSTLMTEVEAILNARPLTHLSMDPTDDSPLTPNHLLLMGSNRSLPPGIFIKEDNYNHRRWRQVQYMADQFWRRWVKEYLPLLQHRQRWTVPRRNFVVDDLVLVADDNAPRGQWPMGRIASTYPDKRGHVRRVEVRIGAKFFLRPISKLCLLEAAGRVE